MTYGGVVEDHNRWLQLTEADPEQSHRYAQRFRELERAGTDIHGEARMVDALLERGSAVLDAGCGGGRLGGYLHAQGHQVGGMDLDPVLIEAAQQDYPGPTWVVGDLATTPFPGQEYDVVACAGNVMTFLAPSTRRPVLQRFHDHLAPGGRVVTGFGSGRDYAFNDFLDDARTCGLVPSLLLESWDLRPFCENSQFLVAVFEMA